MSTTTLPDRFTVRWLLFGDPERQEQAEASLADVLDENDVLGSAEAAVQHLSGAANKALGREISNVISGLCELDLVDILVGGWRKHQQLVEAAKRTLDTTDAEEIVDLATHRISLSHEPKIDILLDSVRVAQVDIKISIEVTVKGLAATVERGRLVALDAGRCLFGAALTVQKAELVKRELDLALPLIVIYLGDGIPLATASV